jgi:hypothetical protein
MKKASATGDPSRGARIATLERTVGQLLNQLTALQTRVGLLEAHQAHQETLARLGGAVGDARARDITSCR